MSSQNSNPPVNHGSTESINGRNPTIPAVPSANSNGLANEHKRTPSMTVTPAGATTYNANGAPQNKSNIQFGSVNGGNPSPSPAMATPTMAHQASASLGVNSLNPRMASPSSSPSPIPQPVQASGGRPPSGMQGPGSAVNFGQFGGDTPDANGMTRSMSQMQLGDHRRGSSQSIHGDMNGPGLPTGPGGRGGYPPQGGRGRGSFSGNYQNQMAYSPGANFRPHNGRGGYTPRGNHAIPYQGSPSLQPRQPMMNNPANPHGGHMQMMPGMPAQQYGYQYPGYGGVPIQADPSISYNYNQQFYPQQPGFNPYAGPPQSPRPQFQGPYGAPMQHTYSGQGAVPTQMSRQSSQISNIERPSSSIGQTPQTPASAPHHPSARTPSVSGDKAFSLPQKQTKKIVIKNANGEVVDFSKPPSSPAPTNATAPTQSSTPAVQTPPSRTGSAVDPQTRSEPQVPVAKNDEDKKKAMQEAVARRIAEEKEQEAEKVRKQKEADDEKIRMEQEAVQAAEREAAAKKEEAEKAEREAKEAEEAKAKADAAPAPEDEEDEFERMAREMEEEAAKQEEAEAKAEAEYLAKKAAKREAEAKAKQEEEARYYATLKEAEREAEERELALEKKRAGGAADDDESKKLFASLKGETATGSGDDSGMPTPDESGAATPISETSMGPPAKSIGPSKRGRAAELTLDTKKPVEPAEPSATLKSLTTAKRLQDPSSVSYPSGFVSPNPALNANAPADKKFKYNKEFLLQFQNVFKEKPSLDWDQRVRETLGDGDSARPQTARTPSGMGGRNPSHRQGANTGFTPMGAFGGSGTMGRGSTSEQRFAASNAAGRGGAMGNNPFAAFGRPGSMGAPMGRQPSNNPMGGVPSSPRVGGSHRGTRNESKRTNKHNKQEQGDNKAMPLTAGMQIGTLETTATGWKPRSVGQNNANNSTVGLDGYMEADVVQRKVKAALNKMTPENFDRISGQILEIAAQSKQETDGRTLRQVIQLVFEKATDEAHWAPMYAKFCYTMLSTMSNDVKDETFKDKAGNVVTGGNLFRKYLLNRCQEEFERGWKVNLPEKPEGVSDEAAMLSDEYYIAAAAKRRGLGLVRFIGELFKLGMLTERIMNECLKKLLDYEGYPDEAEVESLSSLLRTIGKALDSPESRVGKERMDAYFNRINQTMALPELASRLKFMLMDIIDLRRNGWVSKDADKGPKTIQEIHEEAEAKRAADEMQRLASQANRGGGRMAVGRGDARSFSSGYGQVPPPDTSNRIGADDLRRLGGRAQRNTTTPSGSFGPSGLGARTNSGRRGLGPNLNRPDDSNASSRTGTPPASKDKDKKDESSTNAFSALAALDGHDGPTSPPSNPSSPPTQNSQPIDRERSRSPEKKAE